MPHEDQFELDLFEASFDGFPIDIVGTDDDVSRTLVEHEFAFRDGAVLQDTGGVPRRTQCEIVFIPFGNDDELTVLDRVAIFRQILEGARDVPKPFVHPFDGTYNAQPGPISFTGNANDRDFVRMSVTFVEAGLEPAAFEISADVLVTLSAKVADVSSQRDAIDNSLAADPVVTAAAAELDDPPELIAADSLATAENWRDDPTVTVRQITLELGELSERIDDTIIALKLPESVESYPTFIALQSLHGSLTRSADAAIRTAPRLTEIAVETTLPLLTILRDFYDDAQRALDKFDRTLELNDIRNPAIILVNTLLTVEV